MLQTFSHPAIGGLLPTRSQPARPRYSPVARIDPHVRPWIKVLGNLDDGAGRQRGGLGAAGRRVAADAGGRLDDGQLDRVRQLDGDHLVIDNERIHPFHVFGHERDLVAQLVDGERKLVERFGIHEMEGIRITIHELNRPALEARFVEPIGPSIGFLDASLGLQVACLDLVERGGAAGRGGLNLDVLDHVRGAVDFDDHSALEVLGGNHVGHPFLLVLVW